MQLLNYYFPEIVISDVIALDKAQDFLSKVRNDQVSTYQKATKLEIEQFILNSYQILQTIDNLIFFFQNLLILTGKSHTKFLMSTEKH